MKNLLLSILLIFIVSAGNYIKAGNDNIGDTLTCTQKLNKAQKVYDAGNITEVEGLISSCIEEGFTKEEKMQALRLLILSKLFSDDYASAEKNLLLLLKEDPEYVLNPAIDPAEFYQLYNSYRTLPVINIGLMGGLNRTVIHEIKNYSVGTDDSKAEYKARFGFQGGIMADILLYKKFQIHTGITMQLKNFTYVDSILYNNATTLTSKENQTWLEVPLALKYNLGKGKLKLFGMAGGSFGLLLGASSKLSRVNSQEAAEAKESTLKFKKIRNPYTISALIGAGLRYKVGYGYIFLDARYTIGLMNVANPKNRYYTEDGDNLFYYGYVSSNFSVNNLALSVGYMKSFYKPKKVKTKDRD